MIYSIFYFKKNTQNLSELMIFLNDFLFDIYLIRFKCHNLNCNMHFLVRIQKVPFLHQFGVRVCSLAILDASSGSSDSKLWAIMAERRRHKKRIQVWWFFFDLLYGRRTSAGGALECARLSSPREPAPIPSVAGLAKLSDANVAKLACVTTALESCCSAEMLLKTLSPRLNSHLSTHHHIYNPF